MVHGIHPLKSINSTVANCWMFNNWWSTIERRPYFLTTGSPCMTVFTFVSTVRCGSSECVWPHSHRWPGPLQRAAALCYESFTSWSWWKWSVLISMFYHHGSAYAQRKIAVSFICVIYYQIVISVLRPPGDDHVVQPRASSSRKLLLSRAKLHVSFPLPFGQLLWLSGNAVFGPESSHGIYVQF